MYFWKSIKTRIVIVIVAISLLTSEIAPIGHVVLQDVDVNVIMAAIAAGSDAAENCVTMISVFD
ncbi:hypothetical protein M9R32_03700 [Paenisporosarcina quisquiliarum]|uniref:Uncharacterized protein n=1 Tax=Paenisporosarcina quisquiliarum TaxID=365346 RepID=A0A9X3LG22_9BACL|nr:hypothetical protein [Paenisporosarcina quisquiliarum]MCZ8536301.1 hypothetical protein [Paenisporosarcina quisquiliarum]